MISREKTKMLVWKVNHTNCVLAAEGAIPDFVLLAKLIGHNDML